MTDWPYARVLAEALAWPFWAPDSFRLGLLQLERTADGYLGKETAELAHSLQEHLRLRCGGGSLEVLRQVRDFVWFGADPLSLHCRLVDILTATNSRFSATHASGRAGLRTLHADEERAHRWRWISLSLPSDLLTAATPDAPHAGADRPRYPGLECHDLEKLFDRGLAQIHTHLSANLSFAALWTQLMASTGSPTIDEGRLASVPLPFADRAIFLSGLTSAGLARLVMARFLWHRVAEPSLVLETFLDRVHHDGIEEELEFSWSLDALRRGQPLQPVARVRAAYRRYLAAHSVVPTCVSLADLARADPLASCFGSATWPESIFCRNALDYLRESGRPDASRDIGFERLFWQYQRVRCATFRFVTLEPGTSGLDWFVRFFRRISPLRRGINTRVLMDSALSSQKAPDQTAPRSAARLAKLEVRIAPAKRWDTLRQELVDINEAGRLQSVSSASHSSYRRCERGVVLHFQKDDLGSVPTVPRHGGSHGDGLRFVRFGRFYRQRRQQMHAISELLARQPSWLRLLRGLDVCGVELSTPTWVLSPLLTRLRRESQEIERQSQSRKHQLRSLSMTIHVGEDFRTLLEGIRRVYEPIEFGLLHRRDRLGHAVALGIDPESWGRSHSVAYQPQEEHLDDLLWLLELTPRHRWLRPYRDYLSGHSLSLAQDIYAKLLAGYSDLECVEGLLEARRLRHQPNLLSAWNYPDMDPEPCPRGLAEKILHAYLTEHSVWRRGQLPHEVLFTDKDAALLRGLQRWLLNVVFDQEITIEANPTSNLLIAELGALDKHPMFRIRSASGANRPSRRPRIALSDDDSLTFATSLAAEYEYTYYALLRQGVSKKAALRWLESRRKDAMDAAFTLSESVGWRFDEVS